MPKQPFVRVYEDVDCKTVMYSFPVAALSDAIFAMRAAERKLPPDGRQPVITSTFNALGRAQRAHHGMPPLQLHRTGAAIGMVTLTSAELLTQQEEAGMLPEGSVPRGAVAQAAEVAVGGEPSEDAEAFERARARGYQLVLFVGAALLIGYLVWWFQQPGGEPLSYNPYEDTPQSEMYPVPGG